MKGTTTMKAVKFLLGLSLSGCALLPIGHTQIDPCPKLIGTPVTVQTMGGKETTHVCYCEWLGGDNVRIYPCEIKDSEKTYKL